jgi:hypothetical protein
MLSAAVRNYGICDLQHDDKSYSRYSEILNDKAGILRCGHIFCKRHMREAYDAPKTLRRCPICEQPITHEYVLSGTRNDRLRKRALGTGDMSLDPEAGVDSTSSETDSDSDSSESDEKDRKQCFNHRHSSRERCHTCNKCKSCCSGGHRR